MAVRVSIVVNAVIGIGVLMAVKRLIPSVMMLPALIVVILIIVVMVLFIIGIMLVVFLVFLVVVMMIVYVNVMTIAVKPVNYNFCANASYSVVVIYNYSH
jgi:hypothetical protein